jgi:SAM-dependent methyltransferase
VQTKIFNSEVVAWMNRLSKLSNFILNNVNYELIKRKSPTDIVRNAHKLAAANKFKKAWQLLDQAIVTYPRNAEIIAAMRAIPNHYDTAFYETQQAGSLKSAREMLPLLAVVYPFRSVVDIGSGVGTWLRAAAEHGATELVGVEGEWVKDNRNRFSDASYVYADLNTPLSMDRRFDLAISLEVAEHLNPDRSQRFVEDICRSSDVVMFGAAMPRQNGNAHINGRPHSFWIDLFEKRGFVCLDLFRPKVWYNSSVEPWYAQNTFLFVAESAQDRFTSVPPASLVNVYHPLLANRLVRDDAKAGIFDPTSPSY